MGLGIWSMHYVGMEAFRLPVPVEYDWPTVLLSMIAAVAASAVALFVVSRKTMGMPTAVLGSIVMGGGIAAMHYIGMEAMRLPAMCSYSSGVVALSVILAIVISFVALWLTFGVRDVTTTWSWRKSGTALLMGLAIPVMHYVGMAAVSFMPASIPRFRAHPRDQHLSTWSGRDRARDLNWLGICVPDVVPRSALFTTGPGARDKRTSAIT